MNLSYLGRRDYIDISTLSNALYATLPDITSNDRIECFQCRITKKVEFNCDLILEQGPETKFDRRRAGVQFAWKFEGETYRAFLVERSDRIVARRTECVDDPSDYMTYRDGQVFLNAPINDDCIYNLMKMGKMIVTEKFGLVPRVVRIEFDRLYDRVGMMGITMGAKFFAKTNFYKLETFHRGLKFGEILVKTL